MQQAVGEQLLSNAVHHELVRGNEAAQRPDLLELHFGAVVGGDGLYQGPQRLAQAQLLESGRLNGDRRGLSAKTVRYLHTIVHKALADGVLKSNPADRAKAPKPGRSSNRELRFWEPHQLACFLRHVRGTPLEPLWHLAAFTGMRRGELLGVRWGDIDFENKRLSIRRSIVSVGYRIVETTPKTHQARVIDLDPATIAVLESHRAESESFARSEGRDLLATDRVFYRSDGEVLHPEMVTIQFQGAERDCRA